MADKKKSIAVSLRLLMLELRTMSLPSLLNNKKDLEIRKAFMHVRGPLADNLLQCVLFFCFFNLIHVFVSSVVIGSGACIGSLGITANLHVLIKHNFEVSLNKV